MYIILGAVAFLAIIFIALYNGLVSIRNQCDEAWSNVDTELKRRYDLIPNLVNTVKGYASHEKDLIEKVMEMREQAAGNTGSLASQAQDEIPLLLREQSDVAEEDTQRLPRPSPRPRALLLPSLKTGAPPERSRLRA